MIRGKTRDIYLQKNTCQSQCDQMKEQIIEWRIIMKGRIREVSSSLAIVVKLKPFFVIQVFIISCPKNQSRYSRHVRAKWFVEVASLIIIYKLSNKKRFVSVLFLTISSHIATRIFLLKIHTVHAVPFTINLNWLYIDIIMGHPVQVFFKDSRCFNLGYEI